MIQESRRSARQGHRKDNTNHLEPVILKWCIREKNKANRREAITSRCSTWGWCHFIANPGLNLNRCDKTHVLSPFKPHSSRCCQREGQTQYNTCCNHSLRPMRRNSQRVKLFRNDNPMFWCIREFTSTILSENATLLCYVFK